MSEALIEVRDLRKVYRIGFWMRKVEAVAGISFNVHSGSIFGFLGPNGAGKTTTIKVLTGLIAPTSGQASVFGIPVPSAKAMQRVGFMPENPYIYPYLTPREFVQMSGRLSGLSGRAARDRTVRVLEHVGISYAADRPVRRLSKGMLQRTGLAAALVAEPELLILDEPMSGLDPVGRKEVRDLIFHERDAGRTIFFSTHILSDVETLCDRVVILRKGVAVVSGSLRDLLKREVKRIDIHLHHGDAELEQWCTARGYSLKKSAAGLVVEVEGERHVQQVLAEAVRRNVVVAEVAPRHETLEGLFVREAIEAPPASGAGNRPEISPEN